MTGEMARAGFNGDADSSHQGALPTLSLLVARRDKSGMVVPFRLFL